MLTGTPSPHALRERCSQAQQLPLSSLIEDMLATHTHTHSHNTLCAGEALKKLKLPADAERVLFKTDNSAK